MDIRLRRLDMVMEIVAEGLDMGDGLGAPLRGEMAWEEHKGHVADFITGVVVVGGGGGVEVGDVCEFEGRVVAEEDLGGVLDGAAAGVDEFLFSKYDSAFSLSESHIYIYMWRDLRTCKNTLPKIRSVSSRNIVLKITVTRSWLALM